MQKTIVVKNIEYTIHEKPILQGVSFRCNEKERLCIFGENGAGKSTLLKIICNQLEPDAGIIEKQGHIRFEYVPQEFGVQYKDTTVDEYIRTLAGDKLYQRAAGFAKDLGFDVGGDISKDKLSNKTKTCGSLSGGQQKILALAVTFALNPDFILLDEPENHLDIVSRLELVSLLQEFKGGIIFISHDRLLIDAVATKIGEISQGKLHVSEGDYDDYIQMKMERMGGLQRQYDAESKRIRQLSSTIVILQQKALRGKEISAYRRAKEELEGLKKEHNEKGRPDDKKTKIRIAQTEHKLHDGKLISRIKDASFAYDVYADVTSSTQSKKSKSVHSINTFSNVHLEIRSGDKIVLLGRNGSGKSTFLKCMTGNLALKTGGVTWAGGVKWAYFDQHAEFDSSANAIEVVKDALHGTDTEAQAALGAMKFDVSRMSTATANLSGGERMRLRFATVFGLKPDFIILDEPTNHIDEVTWEILLSACTHTKSSILLVTHDYEFIKAFNPTLFWMIHGGTVVARHKELDVLLSEMRG